MQGHLAIVEHLCQASADVNIANNEGATPLSVAVQEVSIQNVRLYACCNSNALSDDNTEIIYKHEYFILYICYII